MLASAARAATGRLLTGLAERRTEFAAIPYASMAVVALALRGVEPVGSGLLVPPGQLPHGQGGDALLGEVGLAARRVTDAWDADAHAVRASVGRLGEEQLLQVGDTELVDRTVAELRGLPALVRGRGGRERRCNRWGGGLPQYEVGPPGPGRATSAPGWRAAAASAVCGAAYDGVGIAACLGSAGARP